MGLPTMTRVDHTSRPFSITSASKAAWLTKTWREPRSCGSQRRRSMLLRSLRATSRRLRSVLSAATVCGPSAPDHLDARGLLEQAELHRQFLVEQQVGSAPASERHRHSPAPTSRCAHGRNARVAAAHLHDRAVGNEVRCTRPGLGAKFGQRLLHRGIGRVGGVKALEILRRDRATRPAPRAARPAATRAASRHGSATAWRGRTARPRHPAHSAARPRRDRCRDGPWRPGRARARAHRSWRGRWADRRRVRGLPRLPRRAAASTALPRSDSVAALAARPAGNSARR